MKSLFVGKNSIGNRFDDDGVFAFFGNRHFDKNEFSRLFPTWSLITANQVHGKTVQTVDLSTKASSFEADALITSHCEVAVAVYTADCVPLIIYDLDQKIIAAVHAGWRGVVADVVGATFEKLAIRDPQKIKIWVGPHILKSSFEVGLDVAEQLKKAPCSGKEFLLQHVDKNKQYVDLAGIVSAQIQRFGVDTKKIHVSKNNTLTDPAYYSYRRGDGGRLINFIVLTK